MTGPARILAIFDYEILLAISPGRMPLKTKPFDAADPLTSPELIDGYLDEAIATGNPAVIRLALSVVARARRRLAVKRRATAALRTDPARGRTLDAPGS